MSYTPPYSVNDTMTVVLIVKPEVSSSSFPVLCTISSYVLPSTGLVIAPRPNGKYYDVSFQVCTCIVALLLQQLCIGSHIYFKVTIIHTLYMWTLQLEHYPMEVMHIHTSPNEYFTSDIWLVLQWCLFNIILHVLLPAIFRMEPPA